MTCPCLSVAMALVLMAGCGDDAAEGGSPAEQPPPARSGESTAGAEAPQAATPAAPEVDPLAEAFDVRLARVEPEAHLGEVRDCAVAFAERRQAVGSRERTRYPVPAVRRVAVRCAAEPGWGWADLVFTEETAGQAEHVRAGRLVRARVVAPAGGFGDYPVLELVELGPTFEPPSPPEPAPEPEPAFDFGRAGDPGVRGSTRPCAVDFTGPIELVDGRDRRVHGYPEDTSHRLAVKCLSADGEAWIDLIFRGDDARRALTVIRGRTVPVRVEEPAGGHAGRPIATLGEEGG